MPQPRRKPRPQRLTDADRANILAMIDRGMSRNDIARESGRSGSTISKIATANKREFGQRTQVAAATEARRVDLRARRQRIVEREIARVEHLQDRREKADFQTILKASFGEEEPVILDFVPTVDERNLADTISRCVVTIEKLERIDGDQGVEHARSLLGQLGAVLGLGA